MLLVLSEIQSMVTNYINSTPPDILGAYLLLYILGPFILFSVLVWGMLEVWVSMKQDKYWASLKWDLLAIDIPQDVVNSPKGMENFFNNLAGSKSAITMKEKWLLGKFQAYFTFEIVSNGGQIQFYIRCVNKYRDLVEAALYAQYPDAQITKVEDYVDALPNDFPNDEYDLFGTEASMLKKYIYPLKTYEQFEHQGEKDLRFKDPLLPLFEIMGKMRQGEYYWLQILIMSPDGQDWRKDGLKYIAKAYGKEEPKKNGLIDDTVGWIPREIMSQVTGAAFGDDAAENKTDDFRMFKITPDERDLLDAVKEKSTKIGWSGKIRFIYAAKHELFRKGTAASMTKGFLNQFDSSWNKLGLTASSTPKDDYFWQAWSMHSKQRILIRKYKNRSFSAGVAPYILSSAELATLFHFPEADARTPTLKSTTSRVSEAPVGLEYASDTQNILPNFDKSVGDVLTNTPETVKEYAPIEPMAIPTPTSPTDNLSLNKMEEIRVEEDDSVPKIGMPAPLPPGLDISDEPIDEKNSPNNLPV